MTEYTLPMNRFVPFEDYRFTSVLTLDTASTARGCSTKGITGIRGGIQELDYPVRRRLQGGLRVSTSEQISSRQTLSVSRSPNWLTDRASVVTHVMAGADGQKHPRERMSLSYVRYARFSRDFDFCVPCSRVRERKWLCSQGRRRGC